MNEVKKRRKRATPRRWSDNAATRQLQQLLYETEKSDGELALETGVSRVTISKIRMRGSNTSIGLAAKLVRAITGKEVLLMLREDVDA